MLVLARMQDESIRIHVTPENLRKLADAGGLEILVKAIECRRRQTRIGVQAPPEVQIVRSEVDDGR